MTIERAGFSIIPDNEEAYFSLMEAAISSVDDLATLSIRKEVADWKFRVTPSNPRYIEMLIHEITELNNIFKLRVIFSKSIKSSLTIQFNISLT